MGSQMRGHIPDEAKVIYYPESGKGFAASRQHQGRSFKALSYQGTQVPPYFLCPKYRGGIVNSHPLRFRPCVGLLLWVYFSSQFLTHNLHQTRLLSRPE